mgnify:FL=1
MKCGMEDGNELQTRKPTDRLLRAGLRKVRRPGRDRHKRRRPLREKTAALWTKLNGVTITPEMINCTGIILIDSGLLWGLGTVLAALDVPLMRGTAGNFTYEKLLK